MAAFLAAIARNWFVLLNKFGYWLLLISVKLVNETATLKQIMLNGYLKYLNKHNR